MAPASTVSTVEHGPVPWNGHERGSREYRRILFALLCAGIATFAQLYSPQGILPGLAHDLHVDPSRASLAVSAATLGLAVSVLPWSLVGDRFGRVAAMRASLIAATALGLLMPWSPSFEVLMVIRVLEGVALGGIPAIAVVYLGEEIVRHHAAVAAGTYVAGTTIGGLLGRLVSGPVATLTGWRTGTFAVALLATVTATVFFLCTPAPRGFTPRPVSVTRVLKAVAAHLRNPRLLVLYAQGFLLMGGFVAVYNYLAFRLEAPPYLMPSSLASLLFLAYLSGTVSSRVAGGIVQRLGRRRVLLGSVAVMILGVLLTLDAHLPVVIVGIVVMTMGFFGAHSIASGWSGARAEHDRAQAASLYNLWYYVGSSVFGYLGGLVYVALGWPGLVAMVVVLAAVAGGWALFAARD
ncbi:MFS transporter [Brachybacterium endophyticum]|uniref:MFS transporter n=2 Tax=Brachybacterium endophyticum TaxID=2182385 RepID=A0A2U2RK32_9MICO|nr:MFS transporter [Brachybacterium endophyticum]